MTYIKDSIYHTSLPILIIDKNKLYTSKYQFIGHGEEGSIFKYGNKKAIKLFDSFMEREKLPYKFTKIEELARIKDKNFCFPEGLAGYLDLKKEGYYMNFVTPMEKYPNFTQLAVLKDMKKIFEYVLIADKAIERIHKKGIVIGDIKGDNILIDKCGEVKFIDTDNYAYLDYDYDLTPCRSKWYKQVYNKEISGKDNDIFVYTMLVLNYFLNGSLIKFARNNEFFKQFINSLNVSNEVKDGLRIILSDAPNKPYVGKILKKINFEEELLNKDNLRKLNNV